MILWINKLFIIRECLRLSSFDSFYSEINEFNTTFGLISRILKPIENRNKLFITYILSENIYYN